MNKMYSVYAIRHNPTGKIYVGCTGHPVKDRIREHIVALRNERHTVKLMQEDYITYGDDYSYFVLYQTMNNRDVFKIEKLYMDLLHTRNPEFGYNYNDITNDFSLDDIAEHYIPLEFQKPNKKHKKG